MANVPKELVDVTTIFLTPATILFGALGVAKTEGLKSAVSAAGILIGLLWIFMENPIDTLFGDHQLLALLPVVFLAVWGWSLRVHWPRHLAYQRQVKVKGKVEGKLVELKPQIAELFEEEEVNQILLAYVALKPPRKGPAVVAGSSGA